MFFRCLTNANTSSYQSLLPRLASEKFRPDFKQSNITIPSGNIVFSAQEQVWQNRRTHLIQVCGNRIHQQHNIIILTTEILRNIAVCKAPGNRFQQPAISQLVLNRKHPLLCRCQNLSWQFIMRQRFRHYVIQSNHSDHFFHKVVLTFNITAPGRRNSFNTSISFNRNFETEITQNFDYFIG